MLKSMIELRRRLKFTQIKINYVISLFAIPTFVVVVGLKVLFFTPLPMRGNFGTPVVDEPGGIV